MGTCCCDPPARLHIRPDGVHLPDGSAATLVLVDEVGGFEPPRCSVCAAALEDTFYLCVPCDAEFCRHCVALDTLVVECDCGVEVHVTGVLSAARRAAAALG
ncbi:MAG: hypothetical protein M3171_14760 [Actinomycetota bacterium]|nr:hypothetical protein [Actinomycetota bacterium]